VTGAGLIAGNVLSLTARTGADISTALNTLDAVITSTGHLIVTEADNLTVNRAITTAGNVNITSLDANGVLTIRTLTAGRGAVNLTAANVTLNGSITAGTNINLAGVGNVQVINGTITAGRSGTVNTGGRRVDWLVTTGLDTGVGSLRNALSGANAFKGPSKIGLADLTVNVTSAALPTVTGNIAITGNSNVTLNGSGLGTSGIGLTISGSNSSLSNVTLANFRATGLSLVGGRSAPADIDVSNVTITGSRLGLSASGQFATSTWQDLTINANGVTPAAGTIGVLLSGATGPAPDAVILSNSTVRNYATGISVSKASARTRIENVAVSNSSLYGLSLAAATGLTVNSLVVSNMTSNAIGTAGIYATGFCTNSSISATTFTGNFNKKLDVTKSRNLLIN
jgi:autotransporter family porin